MLKVRGSPSHYSDRAPKADYSRPRQKVTQAVSLAHGGRAAPGRPAGAHECSCPSRI